MRSFFYHEIMNTFEDAIDFSGFSSKVISEFLEVLYSF